MLLRMLGNSWIGDSIETPTVMMAMTLLSPDLERNIGGVNVSKLLVSISPTNYFIISQLVQGSFVLFKLVILHKY